MRRGLYVRGGTVSLTTDGGRTFRVVLRRGRAVTGLQAFGSGNAIVDLSGVRALRTLDAGRTWRGFAHWTERRDVAEPEVDFGGGGAAFSGGRGFVFLGRGGASPARLLKTTDYGRNWVVVHRRP
jgi:hypothetical protein